MDDAPLIRIDRGTPTAEELAALVGVLLSRPHPGPPETLADTSRWARSARPGARSHRGPAAWRASALPR